MRCAIKEKERKSMCCADRCAGADSGEAASFCCQHLECPSNVRSFAGGKEDALPAEFWRGTYGTCGKQRDVFSRILL